MIARGTLRHARRAVACGVGALWLSCAEPNASDADRSLASRASAELRLDGRLVAELAEARQLSAEQARVLASEDAMLAAELSRAKPALAGWLERVALARSVLHAIGEEAKAAGPPSDAEILALSRQRFWELDRPRMVEIAHAVVLSSDEDEEARALAERIAQAVSSAQSVSEFRELASAVSAAGLDVKVEGLPPVTADGRAVDPDRPPPAGPSVQNFNAEFAAAAHRLERVGQLSPVVRTPFGYHVLYLVRSIDPQRPSLDERRQALYEEIMAQRARELQAALLARQRQAAAPEQERSALSSMKGIAANP